MHQNIHDMRLLDDQWQKLDPLLVGKPSDPGASGRNNRLFIEAVLWIVSNNCAWRHLPVRFNNNANATYMRFRRWAQCGLWRQLAQSDVADPELRLMLVQIANYSDRYLNRLEQRQIRKIHRMNYDAKRRAVADARLVRGTPASPEESTPHWVGLVVAQ